MGYYRARLEARRKAADSDELFATLVNYETQVQSGDAAIRDVPTIDVQSATRATKLYVEGERREYEFYLAEVKRLQREKEINAHPGPMTSGYTKPIFLDQPGRHLSRLLKRPCR
jgi:hypothetical protein